MRSLMTENGTKSRTKSGSKSDTKSGTKSGSKSDTKSGTKSGSKIKKMCVPYGAPYSPLAWPCTILKVTEGTWAVFQARSLEVVHCTRVHQSLDLDL